MSDRKSDLGIPRPRKSAKVVLVFRLDKAIKSLGLTQRLAARRIGTSQPADAFRPYRDRTVWRPVRLTTYTSAICFSQIRPHA
jgi:hypothetical protein